MTSLLACPVCTAPTPTDRITAEVWCCSIACFRTFRHIAASGSPAHEEAPAVA